MSGRASLEPSHAGCPTFYISYVLLLYMLWQPFLLLRSSDLSGEAHQKRDFKGCCQVRVQGKVGVQEEPSIMGQFLELAKKLHIMR